MTEARPHLTLVTGAAKRLGRAIALRLARSGCDIVVHYNTSAAEAASAVAEIETLGQRAVAISFDQSEAAAIATGLTEIDLAFGRLPDVLVNSASVYGWDDIATVNPETLHRHFSANLYGPVLLTRAIAAAATDETRGLIINLLDNRLLKPRGDEYLSYTLTKHALDGFTTLMAQTLAPRFRVCGIAPGYTLPDVDAESRAHFDKHHDRTPLQRGPTADDVAEAAAYLLSAPAITGQTLIIDGGGFLAR